ncbi:MAG TPA: alpha/beta hydrolase [Steroidobacteraceae bacterium]|nr:alpha/beta hydrolase [Steroidobacteraceae bacterium]
MNHGSGMRRDVEFTSHGTTCRAWHYVASGTEGGGRLRPCVAMAHGFGATRDASLQPYAERFLAAGLDVLLFDYRHFGASDGAPRQLVSVRRQLQDYRAAIEYARTLPGVDATRIAAWGTSFSGGHALVTAARVEGVAAAVCQCPMMDGVAAVREILRYAGPLQLLRLTSHGLIDAVYAPFGRAHYVPTVGPPGTLAVMSSADADTGYRALAPPGFRFEVAARIALSVGFYRPVSAAAHARCPVLVQICERDSVAPARAAERAVQRLGRRAEVKHYPIGHFEPYFGANFERSVADQLDFLGRHLGLAG